MTKDFFGFEIFDSGILWVGNLGKKFIRCLDLIKIVLELHFKTRMNDIEET